jgi:outer membrane protein OmpA-like peptidoglycan-associated protein
MKIPTYGYPIALLLLVVLMGLIGCSTQTYVSDENINKYAPVMVEKFVIDEGSAKPDLTVYFGFDQSMLTGAEKQKLDAFIQRVKNTKGEIIISGYTDLTGSSEYNKGLSERRAASITSYLQSKDQNVSNHQYSQKALGKTHPLVRAMGSDANAQNRRGYVFFKPS